MKYPQSNFGKYSIRKDIFLDRLTNYEKAYLIGAYIGDGNSYDGYDMSVKDKEFAIYVSELLQKLTSREIIPKHYSRYRKDRKYNEEGYRVRLSSYSLKLWLEKSTKKKLLVPRFRSKKEIYWFFSAFFDAEGCFKYSTYAKRKNVINPIMDRKKSSAYISVSQKDVNILLQLQSILSTIGIHSNVRTEKKRDVSVLEIYNKNNHEKILRNGHIIIERKRMKIEEYITTGLRHKEVI
jgi:hypothetical protein